MPRGVKNVIPANEPRFTELGILGLSSKKGKTTWVVVRQSVGEVSNRVYDHIPLEKDVQDEHGVQHTEQVSYGSKLTAQAFLDGYTYRESEIEEAE